MILFILMLCFGYAISVSNDSLHVKYEWKYLDYVWKSSSQQDEAINNGDYDMTKNIPFDVQQVADGRIFVTVVREKGVPSTLNIISKKNGEGGPLLQPYPNWNWNTRNDCKGIISVYRVAVDRCNRLWVLDCGKIGEDQVCPPQLLAFNLVNNKLIKRIKIPLDIANNATGQGLLVTPIVNTGGRYCEKTQVYMADTEGYGLVIFDGEHIWRTEAMEFRPDERGTDFNMDGQKFYLADGLLGMALTHDEPNVLDRLLYFRPFASFDMYYTNAADLLWKKNDQSAIRYYREKRKLNSQSVVQAFSSRGILFYSSVSDCSIICWNRHKPFNAKNTVAIATNTETLIFASGIKVNAPNRRSHEEALWVMTNRYDRYTNNVLNFTDVNFRILSGKVHKLVRGTNCE